MLNDVQKLLEESEKQIDTYLKVFESQIQSLISDVRKYGTSEHKNRLRKMFQHSLSQFGYKFRVKEIIENIEVRGTSFASEMTPCCGKEYIFFLIEGESEWFQSFDDDLVKGWAFHISWLEEANDEAN